MKKNIANYLVFQAGWAACLFAGKEGLTWPALAAACVVLALHRFITKADPAEFGFIFAAAAIGFGVDQVLTLSGIYSFPNHTSQTFAPFWMLAIWLCFATTLRHSLAWLGSPWWIAAVAGAVFGPLAYFGSQQLGVIEIRHEPFGWLAAAAQWGVLLPLLLQLGNTKNHAKVAGALA